jgi:hypothetical protein
VYIRRLDFGAGFVKYNIAFPTEAALLGVATGGLGRHAVFLPKLNVMVAHKLLRGLNGCGVVRTIQFDGVWQRCSPVLPLGM